MANNEKKESLQWLKALMGKPDPKADRNLNIQAKIFRQGMIKDRKREDESKPIADERLYQNIKSNLQNQGLLSKSKKGLMESYIERKKEALKLFITALIALLVGAMIPIQIATRGTDDSFFSKFTNMSQLEPEEINTEIVKKDTNPIKYSQDIIGLALSANLDLKSSNDNNKNITLIIYGLKKDELKQDSLRVFLDLSTQIEGNVRVIIKKK
ncbi:hypothetical protein [Candidatus Methylopumilus planktonicus]|uniref:hypothetical protein n=1 Tax=Candidatus Methylopumilus planktonicus TaxID=1581557 RepID=UPI003D18F16A